MKPIAIAFSDLEIADYKTFSKDHSRLNYTLEVIQRLANVSEQYDRIPLLFCGDLFDNPKVLDNYTFNAALEKFKVINTMGINIYAISGNHDQSEQNTIEKHSPSWVKGLSNAFTNFNCLDFKTREFMGFSISGIPYISGNKDFGKIVKDLYKQSESDKRILMIHTDLPDAQDTNNMVIDSVENIDELALKYLNKFDLVICGHIHKGQRIQAIKNGWMLGAPLQKRMTDEGCVMGFWIIYDDMTLTFKPLPMIPTFHSIKKGQPIPDDGNYYKEVAEVQESKISLTQDFNNKASKVQLAKSYLKSQGIKDKLKRKILVNLLNSADD